jgi:hypothetical protein
MEGKGGGLTLARANWALVYTCMARVPTTLSVPSSTCGLNFPCTSASMILLRSTTTSTLMSEKYFLYHTRKSHYGI